MNCRVAETHTTDFYGLSNIWENEDGCVERYRCTTVLDLFYILPQAFDIVIERGISSLSHGKEFVHGLNDKYKKFILHLMSTVILTDSQHFGTQMKMHTSTHNSELSLAQ